MYKNRKGHYFVLKRPVAGGETIVQKVSQASYDALVRKVDQLRSEQKTNDSRALHGLEDSDEFFEKWKADNENNLIDGEK